MGATDGRADADLNADGHGGTDPVAALRDAPERFEMFQAIRLLERAARAQNTAAHRLGAARHPDAEPLRIRARPSTAFPAGQVERYQEAEDEHGATQSELVVNAFGLFGPAGALPKAYTDLLSHEMRNRNTALRDLLDLFNHRLASLYYQAWVKYRLPVAYERRDGNDDPVTQALLSLLGLGTRSLQNRSSVPDAAVVYYAGLFAHRVRNANSLAAMLSDYFARPVRVHQFQGRWLRLHQAELSRLGSAYNRLNEDCVPGGRVWDVQGTFRLSVGPVRYATFQDFMPGGAALTRMGHLTRLYVGAALAFDIQVILDRRDVPPVKLGDTTGRGPRLGRNTWMTAGGLDRDPGDAVFSGDDAEAGGAP